MKITIIALGTRGDVQPYVALGLGLKAAGHEVRLVSSSLFEEFVRSQGLDFAPVGGSPKELINKLGAQLNGKMTPLSRKLLFWRIVYSGLEGLMGDCWNCCQDAEAIIYSQLALPGYHIAEKLKVPCYAAYTNPITRTVIHPHPLYSSDFDFGAIYNYFTYILEEQFRWQLARKKINQWRQETLKLPPINITGVYSRQQRQQIPIIHCYSPHVIPKPPDWPNRAYVTGYWFLEGSSNWQPPKELLDFLAAGLPPVYIGFGSMSDRDPEALTKLALDALSKTGQRGILLTGWGALSNAQLPDNVFKIDSAPHDWLFPKMAAVVHHGGAGTTAAGLRAGVPSIIIPFGADQPFWGKRVAELGVGTKPILRTKLTVESLAAAIRAATSNETMKARARSLGEKIRSEDGVKTAVEIFHRYLSSYKG